LREGTAEALVVLEAGMKYEQVSLSPQDVQLLQARRFQIEDIARFFNVPSVLINDTSGSTVWGSGIEQIITGWYKLGFRPELERIEQSIVASPPNGG
jgi:HK97 family phage portal protein